MMLELDTEVGAVLVGAGRVAPQERWDVEPRPASTSASGRQPSRAFLPRCGPCLSLSVAMPDSLIGDASRVLAAVALHLKIMDSVQA